MIDRTNDNMQLPPVDTSVSAQNLDGGDQTKGVGRGVLGGNQNLFTILEGSGFKSSADGTRALDDGTLEEPQITADEAAEINPLPSKPVTEYNLSRNVMFLIYSMIKTGEKTESDAREKFTNMSVEEMDWSVKFDQDMAHQQRIMGRRKFHYGIAESVLGGVGGVYGGYQGMRNPLNPGLSQSFTALGSSGSGLAQGIESLDESRVEARQTRDQTGSRVAETAMSTFNSVVEDASASVNKSDGSLNTVAQAEKEAIGSVAGNVKLSV